jgi:hypothetical protein
VERFWSRVDRQGPDDCWLWLGALRNGYGVISEGGRDGKQIVVHRLSYDLAHPDDPLTKGYEACHTCDIRWPDQTYRRCVNPAHLFKGTHAENMADREAKGRNGSHLHPERYPRGDRHFFHLHPESIPRGDRHWTRRENERVRRGEENVRAKMTEAEVIEIRRAYAAGEGTLKELGARFGLSFSSIGRIVTRVTWKHVP